MFDRKDFDDRIEERKKAKESEKLAILGALVREAPPMEKLIGDPNWDRFLQHLQGLLESIKGEIEAQRELMENPTVIEHERLIGAKMNLARLREREQTLNMVMDLPKQIIESAKKVDTKVN